MGIKQGAPDPGSYKYVLVRSDRDASPKTGVGMRFVTYTENVISRSVLWEERHVHAIFVNHSETARRAWRLGWRNITTEWLAKLERETPRATSDAQQAVMAVLNGDWQSKKQIVTAAGVKDTEWRTAIKSLLEKGLALQDGNTNRTYTYKRA